MSNPFPKMGTAVPSLRGQGGCCCGRRGLPRAWMLAMYADYLRLGSLAKAGALHGRMRQGMFGIFQTAKLKLNAKKFLRAVVYKGRKFTLQRTGGKNRYLRCTVRRGKTLYLHHLRWEEKHGPIPPGHQVGFKDHNPLNCAPSNLICLPWGEMTRRNVTGENGSTKSAKARLALMLAGKGREVAQLRSADGPRPQRFRDDQPAATEGPVALLRRAA